MLLSIESDHYAVHFNEIAYRQLNTFLESASYTGIFILADSNTHRLCLNAFLANIEGDHQINIIEIEAGEQHKNIATCLRVWTMLSEYGADRKSLLINLGGGVVTDLGGFVASTYMRGIDFINIPTSLLAMTDASVGGKTGVDLGVLKNLVGVINFPKMVVVDTSFLNTLPENHLKSGLAEMLKHGLIADEKHWEQLSTLSKLTPDHLQELIRESVAIKNNIVMQDPGEKNLRKVLNYGHTLGHAIESFFLNTEKPLLHGEAIAVGMILATYISYALADFPEAQLNSIKSIIISYFDKINFDDNDYEYIISLMKYDKKNTGGKHNFVLLSDIGKPVLDQDVSGAHIKAAFDYYKRS